MINIPKGVKDVLPSESYKWQKVRKVIEKLQKQYNLKEISTPEFEHTELFVRGVGESSDIVNKEMYTFLDKGNRSITLKPEGTAGVARSFVENGLFNDTMPLKMWYLSHCFRYEKPQEGRLRQHTQFGVEMYGADTPMANAEILLIATSYFKEFGINPVVHINDLGCPDCKKAYIETLKKYIKPHLNELCPDCQRRYTQNPLRLLDCKVNECKEVLKDVPLINDYLCDDCKNNFNELIKILDSLNINYEINPKLVRGLDYYTNLVFEFIDNDKKMGQNALGAGGRYNNLVEELGGKSTPVVGFGLGVERLLVYLEKKGVEIENPSKVDVYIAKATDNMVCVLQLAEILRKQGYSVETDLVGRSLKAQFKYADKLHAKYVIVIGDDEIAKGEVVVKNMANGEQKSVKIKDIVKELEV